MYKIYNHKNYNFLNCDWFKKLLFPTNSLAKLLLQLAYYSLLQVVIGQLVIAYYSLFSLLITSVAKCRGSWVWVNVVRKNKIIIAKFMKKISII